MQEVQNSTEKCCKNKEPNHQLVCLPVHTRTRPLVLIRDSPIFSKMRIIKGGAPPGKGEESDGETRVRVVTHSG